ncbi:hypothetical protein BDY24DRAFT_25246 [Mrakia frigida]|uniref:uncharacterized protein n=1 Tax=Mrakia frigida TaxID=29902 RepID=UPI003FCC0B65
MDTTRAELESLELLPLTERDVQGVLANSFSDPVSTKVLDFVADADDLNMPELMLGSAARALDNPCKGTYLYQVYKKFRSRRNEDADSEDEGETAKAAVSELKSVLSKKIRSKFILDVKALKQDSLKAGGPSDKFRTKTRIAYDYEGRADPYRLRSTRYGRDFADEDVDADLDESDDDEGQAEATVMDVDSTSNAGGGGRGDVEMEEAGPGPSPVAATAGRVASSDAGGGEKVDVGGSIQQRTLTAKLGEDQNQERPRRRRYRAYYTANMDKPEERKKFPEKSLPVSAFVTDLFGINHVCSRIFFEHALVNGNSRHIDFAIAEGTLVSTRHFKILAKLGRSPLSSMWEALEFQEFFEEGFENSPEEEEEEVRAVKATPQPQRESTAPVIALMDADVAPVAPASTSKTVEAPSETQVDVDPPPPTSDAPSTSTSLAASRPRRSLGKQHYDVDIKEEEEEQDEEDYVEEDGFGDDASSKTKGKKKVDAKGKGKAVEKKGKGRESFTPVVEKKGKGRGLVVKEEKRVDGPYERERLKWIVFLWEMLREEDSKLKLLRKEHKANAVKGKRAEPVKKTDFHRSLANHFGILCNIDVNERSNSNLPKIASYSKSAAANGYLSNEDSDEDEMSFEEEEEEDEIDHDEDERRSTDGREDVEKFDELIEDDDEDQAAEEEEEEEEKETTTKVPAKRKRAAAKPVATKSSSKAKTPAAASISKSKAKPVAAAARGGGKKRKVASSPAPSVVASTSKTKAKSTSKPKPKPRTSTSSKKAKATPAAKSKPKLKTKAKTAAKGKGKATAKGKGKGKMVSDEEEEDELEEEEEQIDGIEEDGDEVPVVGGIRGGDGDSSLSELSDEDEGAGAGAGDEEMEDAGGSGSKTDGGVDDSGVFVGDEDGEMVDELADDGEE